MASIAASRRDKQLITENEELQNRLQEAEETLRAIRSGEVDALIVSTAAGEQVFTLQGADRSYRALVEDMNEGALSLTPDGLILYANQKFATMLKTPLESVIGTSIHNWVAPESQEALPVLLADGGCRMCRAELILAGSDGTTIPVYLSVNPVSVDGTSSTLGVVATDLTEQKKQQAELVAAGRSVREALEVAGQTRLALLEKIEDQRRAEQALRASEAQFRNVFEHSPLGKSLSTMDGDVKVNQAYCDILGYSAEELRSLDWKDITYPDDIPTTEDVLRRLMLGTIASARFEKRYVHKNGSIVWGDTTIGIARDTAGKPLYILTQVIDITARKQADAAVLDLKQHLQRNIEMERLRLAQNLHDAPIQELYGVIYEVEELRIRSDASNSEVLERAIRNIKKTLDTLRATASELRPPTLSRFGLEMAVRSYIGDFSEKNPHIHVKFSLARDSQSLPESMRLVLFRVLQEALANVVRHAQATEVEVRFNFDAEEARLEISDNGKGFSVPDNWLSMVRAGHYGLAGMSERVTAAGGVLSLDSSPSGPTTVRVVMPCSAAGV
jgi:PAS domain S-box-containing protein